MPQIPSYGYDETAEGELNAAKRRVIGYMDTTHERLTEYPATDPTNGKVSVELSELTDNVYMAIKSIETLDNFIRIDQMVADVVSLTQQSAELKKTAKELLNVNNILRKINATYNRLRPNIQYVELSIWTDFTSSADLLRKAAYKFYSYTDNLVRAERRRRGEDYNPPDVVDDDDDDGGPGGGPDGGPDDGDDDAPPDDGGDEDEVLMDYDIVGSLPGASPLPFGPPIGPPPLSPPAPPPSAPKPPKKPAVPVLPLPPLDRVPSDPPPLSSPSTDVPPSARPSLGDKMGLRPYEKLGKDKNRTFIQAYREYTNEADNGTITDKGWDMSQTDAVSKDARKLWIEKLETYYNDKRRLPTAPMRYKMLLDAIKETKEPSSPDPSTVLPPPALLPPPPPKKPKKPVLTGPPLADLPPPRPSPPIAPPVASPPPKAPSKFSDEELFWPDLVAETIAITDIDKIKALPTWPDLTTSQQTKFEDRFNLDKSTLASGQAPKPLKPNSVYFTVWKKLLGTSTPRTFKKILGTSKTPRNPVRV